MQYNIPNTRERVAARRQTRKGPDTRKNHATRNGSYVRPGPRRTLVQWIQTGKIISLILLLTAVIALFYVFTAPRFSVQHVEITGNNALNSANIIDEAGIIGQSIWFIEQEQIQQRLLNNPYIEQVHIHVAMPDRATIHIAERRPEVRWQLNNVQYLVDSSGKVLGIAEDSAAATTDDEGQPYLVIVDTSNHLLEPGDNIDPDALTLAQALTVRLPTELAFTPNMIGWDFALGVYVLSPSQQTIVFGQTAHLERKLLIFERLLKDQTAFTYLDLRPSNPFYRNDQPSATSP